MNTFGIDRPLLSEILKDIGTGSTQLPDFQRDWRWDDYRVRSLLASVSQAFPIGAVLTLAADGRNLLKSRLIEGVTQAYNAEAPDTLILDGQQRLTALFQALKSKQGAYTLNTKGEPITRYYYLDIEKCLSSEADREEAVISCREDRRVPTDNKETIVLASPEMEYKNALFPVNQIFDSDDWGDEYKNYWRKDPAKRKLFNIFNREVIECFKQYNLPIIHLRKNTPREAVCLIFEKVNTRGVTLTIFELLTAAFAIDNFPLREDWDKRFKRLKKFPVLRNLDSTDFLRALTLLSSNANPKVSTANCTRREILRLTVEDYRKWADIIEDGFIQAAKFLYDQKIFRAKDLPYQTQLITLAAILGGVKSAYESAFKELKEAQEENQEEAIEEAKKAFMAEKDDDQKIRRWYWCGIFGEMYAGAANTQIATDFSQVTSWLREETDLPSTVRDVNFSPNRLIEVQNRSSAVYKGVHALLIPNECRDFRTGIPIDGKIFFDHNIDIHHIFPRAWCEDQNIKSRVFNSIVNKTPLSRMTNQKIGRRKPSEYLLKIREEVRIDKTEMDKRLTSHLISPDTLSRNDFRGFFNARKKALLTVIQKAIGKKIIHENIDIDDMDLFDGQALVKGSDTQG